MVQFSPLIIHWEIESQCSTTQKHWINSLLCIMYTLSREKYHLTSEGCAYPNPHSLCWGRGKKKKRQSKAVVSFTESFMAGSSYNQRCPILLFMSDAAGPCMQCTNLWCRLMLQRRTKAKQYWSANIGVHTASVFCCCTENNLILPLWNFPPTKSSQQIP